MGEIYLGLGANGDRGRCCILGRANRHGLIAGATGTGKTVTLQGIAEQLLPRRGAGVRGRCEGRSGRHGHGRQPISSTGSWNRGRRNSASPIMPIRQSGGVLGSVRRAGPPDPHHDFRNGAAAAGAADGPERHAGRRAHIAFRYADENGLLLLDLEDLQAMLAWWAENAASFRQIRQCHQASVGSIQRQLLTRSKARARAFFGEPAFEIADFIALDGRAARVNINVLAADKLMQSPKLYATFLLWLLSELFETLPEVGDPESPSWCSSSTRRTCCSTMRPMR
jgi:uncharacterized protein